MSWWRKEEEIKVTIPTAQSVRESYPKNLRFHKWEERILGVVLHINTLVEIAKRGEGDGQRHIYYSSTTNNDTEINYVKKRFRDAGYTVDQLDYTLTISW